VRRASNKRSLIGALICGIAALLWTLSNFQALQLGWASRSWPTCPATITKSDLRPRFGKVSPAFEYSYTVAGRTYSGSDYDSFGPIRTKDFINRLIEFHMGVGVSVSYSPQNPSTAMIMAGFQRRHLMTLALGVFLWVMAGSLFADAIRRAKNPAAVTALD
jgi:hypothetical protein